MASNLSPFLVTRSLRLERHVSEWSHIVGEVQGDYSQVLRQIYGEEEQSPNTKFSTDEKHITGDCETISY